MTLMKEKKGGGQIRDKYTKLLSKSIFHKRLKMTKKCHSFLNALNLPNLKKTTQISLNFHHSKKQSNRNTAFKNKRNEEA